MKIFNLFAVACMMLALSLPSVSSAKSSKVLVWEGVKPYYADVVKANFKVGSSEEPNAVYAEIQAGESYSDSGETPNIHDPNIRWSDSQLEKIDGMVLNPETKEVTYKGVFCGTYNQGKNRIKNGKCDLEATNHFKKVGEGIYAVEEDFIQIYLEVPTN